MITFIKCSFYVTINVIVNNYCGKVMIISYFGNKRLVARVLCWGTYIEKGD